MAIFHLAIQVIKRSKGKSAVASSAYRSGTKMTNEYDGEIHDYTRKGGIHSSAILLPPHAPKEYADRSTLWNAVEKIEKQHNAQLAREIEVSIPKEIPSDLWQRMMIDFCNSNFVKQGMIADLSIHNKDPNNPHCHIMLTMRPIDKNGKWLAKSRKVYDLDSNGQRIKLASGNWKSHKEDTTDWNSQDNAELWRANWSEHCNLYLENLGHTERIDHRSYERQGIDQIPQIHLGVSASQMEQKGIKTDRGNCNREILNDNQQMKILRTRISRLMKWQREEMAKPLDLEKAEIKTSVIGKLYANKGAVKNQNKTVRDLKADNKVHNFMQTHNIETMPDFSAKVVDLNTSFYELKKLSKANNTAIVDMDNRIKLWSEYEPLKKYIFKYNELNSKDKKAFITKYRDKFNRYDELQKVWKEIEAKEGKVAPKQWQKTRSTLADDNKLCEWKMKALKEEIGTAERIQKLLDKEVKEQTQVKDKKRVTENEL